MLVAVAPLVVMAVAVAGAGQVAAAESAIPAGQTSINPIV